MSWLRYAGLLLLIYAYGATAADGYIVGIGAEADTDDSRAFSAFGEVATGERTWLSAGAAATRSGDAASSLDALYADAQIDHWFEPLGVRFAAAYWGDPDVLDSVDLRSSIYIKTDRFSVSADFERRNFDFVFGSRLLQGFRTAEFTANGVGFAARLQASDRVELYAGGTGYDYSRDIRLEPGIDDLRFLSVSRLILANSLLDRKMHAGIDVEFGARSLDFRYANWRTAVDGARIDSFGIGLLTPLGASSDIEFRLSRDDSDTFGDSTVLSVFLYFFGG